MKLVRPDAPPAHSEGLGRVLITDGGPGQARSTLAAVRALAKAGYRPSVTVSGPHSIAGASRYCERRVPVPPAGDSAYAARVNDELRDGYLTVLPASDAALVALGHPGAELADKSVLYRRASGAGILTPATHHFASRNDLLDAARELDYPIVVKPSLKLTITKGQSARRVASAEELVRVISGDDLVVQPYIEEPLRAVCGLIWNGRIIASVHQRYIRTWPADCGTACAAETVAPDLVLEERVTRLLSGFNGIFQAQLAGPYLLDLNPRIYGSLPLAVAAGVNLPALLCDLVRGISERKTVGEVGRFYRWVEGDIRHALHRAREGHRYSSILRDLRPHRHAAHSTEALSDPAPMLLRLRHVLTKQR